jgi:Rrf2 family protein
VLEVLTMIPKTAEYALRAVVALARDLHRSYSAEQVAKATRVPRRYAHKVLQALVRAGFVRSQPGPGGGYALVRPPEELSILDVVSAVEPITRLRRCPLGLKTHTSLCPLHRELDEAYAAMERAFGRVTIAQVLNQPGGVPPLCELEQDGEADPPRARRDGCSRETKQPAPRSKRHRDASSGGRRGPRGTNQDLMATAREFIENKTQ